MFLNNVALLDLTKMTNKAFPRKSININQNLYLLTVWWLEQEAVEKTNCPLLILIYMKLK